MGNGKKGKGEKIHKSRAAEIYFEPLEEYIQCGQPKCRAKKAEKEKRSDPVPQGERGESVDKGGQQPRLPVVDSTSYAVDQARGDGGCENGKEATLEHPGTEHLQTSCS